MEKKVYHCYISGEIIPDARVEFLLDSGLPPERWTTVKNSQVKKVQGLFLQPTGLGESEVDTSNLMIVNRVYSDTVRSVMGSAVQEADPEVQEEDIDTPKDD